MHTLFQSIINGDFDRVQAELESTWYGTVDENGLTGLHYAALYGYPEIGQLFIDKGLFVNRTTYDGQQPLHLASQAYQDSMVDMLMQNGAAILAVDYEGNTPLHYAVEKNPPPEFVQKLIDLGSDVHSANNLGQTPLNWVEASDNSEVLVVFLNNNVISDNLSPLLQAVVDGNVDAVKTELNDAWYGSTDLVGFTGLHYAAALGQAEIAQLFIDSGLFVNRTTYDGKQPLHIASMAHQDSMVDYLMTHGGAIKAVDYIGNTPLHYAVKNNPNTDFIAQLLSYGADINAKNNAGKTPLALVEDNATDSLFLYLLESGATSESISTLLANAILGDVDGVQDALTHTWYGDTDKNGMTGVHFAAQYSHPDVAQLFIESGLFINQTNYNGEQPLHIAAQYQQADMVNFLMDNGAAIKAVDFEGNTPLHYGVSNNPSLAFVQNLLDHGADIYAENNEGLSPLKIVESVGNSELVDLLLDHAITPLMTPSENVVDAPLALLTIEDEPANQVEDFNFNTIEDNHTLTEDDIFNLNLDDLLGPLQSETNAQHQVPQSNNQNFEVLAQPQQELLPEIDTVEGF